MGRNRAIGNRLRAGGSSTDSDALGWAAAVTAAGGTYTAAHLSAVSSAIRGFKSNGTWTKRAVYNPLAGDQLAAALIQYKSGVWAAATNVSFVAGDYTPTTGLTGNGTTKYLDTGFVATTLTANSTHLAAYQRTNVDFRMGATSNVFELLAVAGTYYSDQYDVASGRVSAAVASMAGFQVGSRVLATDHAVYRNGSSIGTSATSGGSLPATNLFVFAVNNGAGAPTLNTASVLASYSAGSGLSAAEIAADYTIEQAYQTAMGRNV